MAFLVTLAGLDATIRDLALKEGTLKARLLQAIRSRFPSDESLAESSAIAGEELIGHLWGISSAQEIKNKRKSFSSLKSSLNKGLRQLIKKELNPEGIIISRENTFVVSAEKKDSLLQKLRMGSSKEAEIGFQDLPSETARRQGLDSSQDLRIPPLSRQDPAAAGELTEAVEEVVESEKDNLTGEKGSGPEGAEPATLHPDEFLETELLESDELEEVELLDAREEAVPGEPGPAGGGNATDAESSAAGDDFLLLDEETELLAGVDELEEVEEVELLDTREEAAPGEPRPAAGGGETGAENWAAGDNFLLLDEETELLESDEVEEVELLDAREEAAPGEPGPAGGGGETGAESSAAGDDFLLLDEETELLESDEVEEVELLDAREEAAPSEPGPVAGGGETGEESSAAGDDFLLLDEETELLDARNNAPRNEPVDDLELQLYREFKDLLAKGIEPSGEAPAHLPAEKAVPITAPPALASSPEKESATPAARKWPSEQDNLAEGEPTNSSGKLADPPAGQARDDVQGLMDTISQLMNIREGSERSGGEQDEEYLAQIIGRVAPRYLEIPAGDYKVSAPPAAGLEQPGRTVRLDSFKLGKFPVTNDLFELFVRETGHVTDAEKRGYGLVFTGRFANHSEPLTGRAMFTIDRGTRMSQVDGADWRHPSGPDSSIHDKHRHPVVQVSLADALAFACWAGRRIPSEEEWETAAGGDGRLYPWGNDWSGSRANLLASLRGDTTAVNHHGPEGASPFGIHDLIGNVYEWTTTVHSPLKTGGRGRLYVLKGGSWVTTGQITIAHRLVEKEAQWSNIIGFRCAG